MIISIKKVVTAVESCAITYNPGNKAIIGSSAINHGPTTTDIAKELGVTFEQANAYLNVAFNSGKINRKLCNGRYRWWPVISMNNPFNAFA